MQEGAPPSTPSVSPVDRAFQILQVIVAAGEPLGVREIGRRTGLPRSTASRLVASLDSLGMVERTADALVAPGSALATLQPGDNAMPSLRDQLRPLLTELVNTFGEHAALSIDDGEALLYVDQVAGENPVSVDDVAGERQPFHLVAPGLMAMASWPSERLDSYLSTELHRATEFSTTDPRMLRRRAKRTARDGYVWADQELDVGINGLAVPLTGDNGEVLATLSLYGPSYRFNPADRPTIAGELIALVNQRSSALLRQEVHSKATKRKK